MQLVIINRYHKIQNLSKKVSLKLLKISNLKSKSPSQLRFAGEQLLWGTARGVLFGIHVKRIEFSVGSFLSLELWKSMPDDVKFLYTQLDKVQIAKRNITWPAQINAIGLMHVMYIEYSARLVWCVVCVLVTKTRLVYEE